MFERHRIAHAWRDQRWDSFCLVTTQLAVPAAGSPLCRQQSEWLHAKDEIVDYVQSYADRIGAPVREGVGFDRLSRDGDV